ncbi:MinD/ParA family ATP-binding protein [Microbacterium rhizophilus]|uniref:MinD/ParA family ATP-binding protein n=1 Tax=Microbacterium rhizophilus TaxID=3138934 RepID=UPI0031E8EAD5
MPASETATLIATVHPDGSAAVVAGDVRTEFGTTSVEDGRQAIMMHAIAAAQDRESAIRLHVTEPDGAWPLIVHADGNVEPDEDAPAADEPDHAEAPSDPQHEGDETPSEAAPTESPDSSDPLESGHPTTRLPLLDIAYDDDDDDSDVVDDPSPEPPTRRQQREAPDARPADEPAPQPMSASATPKATAAVDPVMAPQPTVSRAIPAPAPAPAPGPDAILPPTPRRGEVGAPPAPMPTTPGTSGADAMDVFASLQSPSPQAPATDAAAPREGARSRGERKPTSRRAANGDAGPRRRETATPDTRRSFLTPEHAEEPAERGWRGFLTKAGMRVPPSAEERSERADMSTVSQHWPGPRTIAIVNAKGGSGKTPTTILTSAVFARYGGAGVLAWDNNQTRGTLGWRTEQGPHDASLHDLLPETDRLLGTQAQSADLARFVHHQTRDRYDVLRSRPMLLADEQRLEKEDIDRIHSVAAKYYRLIIMDSGNDESDPMWRRMIDLADQIVLATTTRAETAEAGALLLEALADRDERSAQLVHNSVAIVSQADPHADPADVRGVIDGYRELSREAAAIPYDPAMAGGFLHFNALRPATRRAWLAATAAIARGLGPQQA